MIKVKQELNVLRTRVITAIILALIAVFGIFILPLSGFVVFVSIVAAIAAWEWSRLSSLTNVYMQWGYAALILIIFYLLYPYVLADTSLSFAILSLGFVSWIGAFFLVISYPKSAVFLTSSSVRLLLGVLLLVPLWVGLISLKQQPYHNFVILYVFVLVWVADIGAYFAGRRFGKKKLAVKVSPGKSWAGFYGGLIAVMLTALVVLFIVHTQLKPVTETFIWQLLLMSFLTALVSVLGDLFESMLKRHVGFKDSSALLPGHGGVLDRVDSLAAAVPVFAFLLLLFNWQLG